MRISNASAEQWFHLIHMRILLTTGLFMIVALEQAMAQPIFSKVNTGPIVTELHSSWGCAWGDYDDDGSVDLFVANLDGHNSLFHNLGNGSFDRVTNGVVVQDNAESEGCAWGDFDSDGDLDLIVVNWGNPNRDLLYRNTGNGAFELVERPGLAARDANSHGSTAAWGDYDNDGWLDLVISVSGGLDERNDGTQGPRLNALYRNLGTGSLEPVREGIVATEAKNYVSATWVDFDNDGDLDLHAGTWFPQGVDSFYVNDGGGLFSKLPESSAILRSSSRSNAGVWGDYDNDGDLDALVLRFLQPNQLFRNDGPSTPGFFTDLRPSVFAGKEDGIGGAWGDYDNDGDLDFYVANGGRRNELLTNQGNGTFRSETSISQFGDLVSEADISVATAWADIDNDGFLDLFVSNSTANRLYRNNGNRNNWLLVDCDGRFSNRTAIGAKIYVQATINGQSTSQLRVISGGGGYGQNDPRAHFGLGDAAKVETLRIEYPSGVVQEWREIAVNQIFKATEAPHLSVEPAVRLSWPILAEDYVLESAPEPDGPWTAVEISPQPQVVDDATVATVPVTGKMQLFRLRMP